MRPLRTVLVYIIVGILWIALSDRVLALFITDPHALTLAQTLKGWLYVAATSVLLYLLIRADTSALLKSNAALAASEKRYRRIVETALEGIWVLDANGRTTYANSHLAKMLSTSIENTLGRSVYDFMDADMQPEMQEHLRKRRQGIAEQYDFRFRRADGSPLWVIVSTSPIFDDSGEFAGSFAMLTDVTERHMAYEREKELDAHKREFYRRTILAATEGKLVIADYAEIKALAGPAVAEWDIKSGEDLAIIRDAVDRIAAEGGMDEARRYDFVLSIGEATTNAYKHAGGGHASLHRQPQGLLFMVTDHGGGISALTLPEVALVKGFSTAGSLGMGYKAMISIADKVFLATGQSGTTVAIEMAFHPSPAVQTSLLPDTWNSLPTFDSQRSSKRDV